LFSFVVLKPSLFSGAFSAPAGVHALGHNPREARGVPSSQERVPQHAATQARSVGWQGLCTQALTVRLTGCGGQPPTTQGPPASGGRSATPVSASRLPGTLTDIGHTGRQTHDARR